MYKDVWRYLELEAALEPPNVLLRVNVWLDLLVRPLLTIAFWVCVFCMPSLMSWFRVPASPSKFQYAMYALMGFNVLKTCAEGWSDMIEYYHLGTLFLVSHIKHARSGFPYAIRSPVKSHHLFRYAAAEAATARSTARLSERPSDSPQTSPGRS